MNLMTIDVDSSAETLLQDDLAGDFAPVLASVATKKRKGFVTPEKMARNWRIGLALARVTLANTTQRAVRDFTHSTMGRCLRPWAYMLKHVRLRCKFYTDTYHAKVLSLCGNKCAQVYATYFAFVSVHFMTSKGGAHYTLDEDFRTVGIPMAMIPDNTKELTLGQFRKKCLRAQCPILPVEAYTRNANLAEGNIRELKRLFRREMDSKHIPEGVCDDCLVWCAKTRSSSCLNLSQLQGQTPLTHLTGKTTNISHLCEFGFYEVQLSGS
jgi:hypothetical protein